MSRDYTGKPDEKPASLTAWEARKFRHDVGSLAGQLFHILYEDSAGELTGRMIRLDAIATADVAVYVEAFCFLRGDERTFHIAGIHQIVSCASGEVLGTGSDWLNGLSLTSLASTPGDEVQVDSPPLKYLGRDPAGGSRLWETSLNLPDASENDPPATLEQRAVLWEAFSLPESWPVSKVQAYAVLAYWDYAGALVEFIERTSGARLTDNHRALRLFMAGAISHTPAVAADIAQWSARRRHQPISRTAIEHMSHFPQMVELALAGMKQLTTKTGGESG